MSTHATGTFDVEKWDEKTIVEIGGKAKITHATVTQSFHGDVEGEGTVEYLMAYRDDGTASFVGIQRVIGSIGGRSGSFVLQLTGTYDGSAARAAWSVVQGSGTDDLRTLHGDGGFVAEHGPKGDITLDYDFD